MPEVPNMSLAVDSVGDAPPGPKSSTRPSIEVSMFGYTGAVAPSTIS